MPKPAAGWTSQPIFSPHPKIGIQPYSKDPEASWWADPSLSWEEFSRRAAMQTTRMETSRIAAYVNPAARFAE